MEKQREKDEKAVVVSNNGNTAFYRTENGELEGHARLKGQTVEEFLAKHPVGMVSEGWFDDDDLDDVFQSVIDEQWPVRYMRHVPPCPLTDERNAGCPRGHGENCACKTREAVN